MLRDYKYLWLVFLLSLIVRGVVFAQVAGQQEVILQPDSRIYLALAENLQSNGVLFPQDRPTPTCLVRVPGYPLFLAAVSRFLGENLLAVVLVQIVLDSLSCVMVYQLGEILYKGTGLLSGLLSCFSVNMVTYSHFILSDTLFLLFFMGVVIGLCTLIRDPRWRWCVSVGAALGIATLTRSVTMYFPLFIIPFLFVFFVLKSGDRKTLAAAKVGVLGAVFCLCLMPWVLTVYSTFGRGALSAQSGEHLLQYIVPSVWQQSKGTPFIEGMRAASRAFEERAEKEGFEHRKEGPFEVNDFQLRMAVEYLKEEPVSAIAKAWSVGAAKNLFAPAVVDMSYLLGIERPHFSYTEGKNVIEQTWNFVVGTRGVFSLALVASMMLIAVSRVLQLWGLSLLLRKDPWKGSFFLLIIGYFLLVSGPVGYAKYRLPFEPILTVLLAVGIKDLIRRRSEKAGDGIE